MNSIKIRMKKKAVLNCRTTQSNCLQKQDFIEILYDKTGLKKKGIETISINPSEL